MSAIDTKTALILVAHGTKTPQASAPVFEYARALSETLGIRVEPCLREFIEPSIPTVVKNLIDDGFASFGVLPYFLFDSGHVLYDLRKDFALEEEKYPGTKYFFGEPLGMDALLLQLLEKRARTLMEKLV